MWLPGAMEWVYRRGGAVYNNVVYPVFTMRSCHILTLGFSGCLHQGELGPRLPLLCHVMYTTRHTGEEGLLLKTISSLQGTTAAGDMKLEYDSVYYVLGRNKQESECNSLEGVILPLFSSQEAPQTQASSSCLFSSSASPDR